MKKVLLLFLSLTLIFTFLSVSACKEEDETPLHVHSYVNGVCECGDGKEKQDYTRNFVGGKCSTCAWVASEGLLLTLTLTVNIIPLRARAVLQVVR